jgi:hypothetical protein
VTYNRHRCTPVLHPEHAAADVCGCPGHYTRSSYIMTPSCFMCSKWLPEGLAGLMRCSCLKWVSGFNLSKSFVALHSGFDSTNHLVTDCLTYHMDTAFDARVAANPTYLWLHHAQLYSCMLPQGQGYARAVQAWVLNPAHPPGPLYPHPLPPQ